jgi:CubicO group peptidase (beta-lactamase class C family)
MKTHRLVPALVIGGILAAGAGAGQVPTASHVPKDSDIRRILASRIDKYRQSVGIVVGVIEPKGRRIVAYGALDQGNAQPLNGDTVFEIGSITKVFTSLLLADMVQRGEVALDDPVGKYLPAEVKVPQRNGRQITLQDLATHTSGLPEDPSNINPRDPANPLADYSADRLYAFLSSYTLERDIGSRYEYSNLGAALLGQALARHAGMDYEALVEARISKPLGMSRTRLAVNEEMVPRLAVGHSYMLERLPNWDMTAFAPSGGLKSTASDLLALLSAALGLTDTPLNVAMAVMLNVRRPAGDPTRQTALGWDVLVLAPGYEFIFKDGATGGYRSFIGWDRSTRTGVVVLTNAAATAGIADIGMHLLNPEIPLEKAKALSPPKHRVSITVDPKVIDGYVGQYRFSKDDTLTVTRDGDRLFEQRSGELKSEIYPESRRDYFSRLFDEQVTFQVDGRGLATALIYTQNGIARRAQRVGAH